MGFECFNSLIKIDSELYDFEIDRGTYISKIENYMKSSFDDVICIYEDYEDKDRRERIDSVIEDMFIYHVVLTLEIKPKFCFTKYLEKRENQVLADIFYASDIIHACYMFISSYDFKLPYFEAYEQDNYGESSIGEMLMRVTERYGSWKLLSNDFEIHDKIHRKRKLEDLLN